MLRVTSIRFNDAIRKYFYPLYGTGIFSCYDIAIRKCNSVKWKIVSLLQYYMDIYVFP